MSSNTNNSIRKTRLDEREINQFASAVMHDLDSTAHCALAYIGDILGFYKEMAKAEDKGVTSQELANITHTSERYVRDWLAEQASKQYIFYDDSTDRYTLSPEHAAVLADETSQSFLAGGFQLVTSILRKCPKIVEAIRTGEGFEWSDHDVGVYEGQARLNSSQYRADLTDKWIPALIGVEDKLKSQQGANVADIGCGYGISTSIMAKAYPNSRFVGFDNHAASIEVARKKAIQQELADEDRLKFITAQAESFPAFGDRYDLVTFFDCFHDMGNPFAVARHVKEVLKADGTLMLIEMASSDRLVENIHSPVGTNGYAGSIFVCLPTAFAQIKKSGKYVGSQHEKEMSLLPLGGMPGPKIIETVLLASGFTKFRCAFRSEYSMILEAKP